MMVMMMRKEVDQVDDQADDDQVGDEQVDDDQVEDDQVDQVDDDHIDQVDDAQVDDQGEQVDDDRDTHEKEYLCLGKVGKVSTQLFFVNMHVHKKPVAVMERPSNKKPGSTLPFVIPAKKGLHLLYKRKACTVKKPFVYTT
eukprot:1434549-Amphidinium_carterae.2